MESFLRDEVDLAYVTRVALVPFENNSKDQYAAERVRGMTITQILAQGLFDVVDKGLVDSALREEGVDLSKAPMDAGTLKRVGQRLNVNAFMLGSIDQAGDVQRGNTSYPELSITLRLVDTNTGMIFWQASGSRTGDSMGKRLFGLGSDDEFKIALSLLRQLLATISAEQKVKLPVAVTEPPKAAPAEIEQQVEPKEEEGAGDQDVAGDKEAAPEEVTPAGEPEPLDPDDPMNQGGGSEPPAPATPDTAIETQGQDAPAPAVEPAEQEMPKEEVKPDEGAQTPPPPPAEPADEVPPPSSKVEEEWPE